MPRGRAGVRLRPAPAGRQPRPDELIATTPHPGRARARAARWEVTEAMLTLRRALLDVHHRSRSVAEAAADSGRLPGLEGRGRLPVCPDIADPLGALPIQALRRGGVLGAAAVSTRALADLSGTSRARVSVSSSREGHRSSNGKEGVSGSSPEEGFPRRACYSPRSAVARPGRSLASCSAGYPVGTVPLRTASLASRITSTAGRRVPSHSPGNVVRT
jgi:hypothetical protein